MFGANNDMMANLGKLPERNCQKEIARKEFPDQIKDYILNKQKYGYILA